MTQPVDIDYEPEGLPPGSVNIFAPVAVAGAGSEMGKTPAPIVTRTDVIAGRIAEAMLRANSTEQEH